MQTSSGPGVCRRAYGSLSTVMERPGASHSSLGPTYPSCAHRAEKSRGSSMTYICRRDRACATVRLRRVYSGPRPNEQARFAAAAIHLSGGVDVMR